jgi:flavocytochrome c
VTFLSELGVPTDVVVQCAAHSHARTHRSAQTVPNFGEVMMRALENAVAKDKLIVVRTGTCAKELVLDPSGGRVCGLRVVSSADPSDAQPEHVHADAVILATGGYARPESSLLHAQAPHLATLPTTNGPFATGDGIELGVAVGARALDLDKVQLYPTALVDPARPEAPTKMIAPEGFCALGGLLLDDQGHRFVNELDTRQIVTQAILALPSQQAHLLLDEAAAEAYGMDAIRWYEQRGLLRGVRGLAGVASELCISESALAAELAEYSEAAERGVDAFGKTRFPPLKIISADYDSAIAGHTWLMVVTPALHYSMGGLAIDADARVLSAATGEPIGGLYAAGEVCGGVHGENRLAGNSLLECIVFGRTAGRIASAASVDAFTAGGAGKGEGEDQDGRRGVLLA